MTSNATTPPRTPTRRLAGLGAAATLALIVSAPALAIGPDGPAAADAGEPVQNIPDAGHIRDWTFLDDRTVIVSVGAENGYLLTLKHQCHGLAWAQNVQVSMSNETIWAGFDAIRADGRHCPIDRISKLSARELLELER